MRTFALYFKNGQVEIVRWNGNLVNFWWADSDYMFSNQDYDGQFEDNYSFDGSEVAYIKEIKINVVE